MKNECKKFIDFIITQKCTYKCPYCSQSKEQDLKHNEASQEIINSFFKLLKTLDKNFEITITGGEALLHPKFFDIINEVKKLGFKINLITNLSFKIEKYIEIFKLLNENLNRFDVSFHLTQIQDFASSLTKLEQFILNKPKNTKITFFIPIYDIDNLKEQQIEKLLEIAKKYNIEYSFQKIRYINNYSKEKHEKFISKHRKNETFGKLCYAGNKSLVIYENGNAYRCYSSRFAKTNHLGNIKDKNFKLINKPTPCCQKNCTCPKPNAYNQILQDKNYINAILQNITNVLFFPVLATKNIQIIKNKLKQKIKQQNRFS